nr:uncharacterized protein LOC109176675 [Ipomoea batatas]
MPKIEADPQYKIKYVQQDVKAKWGVNVDYKKAWYARVRALETLHGKWDESYNLLPKTLFAIQQTNPGTIVDIVGIPTNTPDEFHFKYAFWAFKAAIDGFKYCLPVLTIDGTHLYGKYKGNLLLALSMNAKEINGVNAPHPMAFQNIQDVERYANEIVRHGLEMLSIPSPVQPLADSGTWAAVSELTDSGPWAVGCQLAERPMCRCQRCSRSLTAPHRLWAVTSLNGPCAVVSEV